MMDPASPDLGKPVGDELSNEARQWAMFAHLASLIGYIIPLGNIIGPLVVWLIKKDEFPFVDDQGKESLNFQISMLIYITVSALAIFICVGIVTTPVLVILDLVFTIIAAIKANQGEYYRYPLTIRLVK